MLVFKVRRLTGMIAVFGMILATSMKANAQERVAANVGADLVSSYVWRGQDLGNAAIQPNLSLNYRGLSLSAWGSVGLVSEDVKELDLTLGYAIGDFSVSLTDYWFNTNPKYFDYAAHSTAHVFEAQIGYDFGILDINWYTNIAGADGINKEGGRAYSSYIQLNAPFTLGGLEWDAEIGATPWATSFYAKANGFTICDVALKAYKDFKISDAVSIPVFAKIAWNPATEGAHFVFGLSF